MGRDDAQLNGSQAQVRNVSSAPGAIRSDVSYEAWSAGLASPQTRSTWARLPQLGPQLGLWTSPSTTQVQDLKTKLAAMEAEAAALRQEVAAQQRSTNSSASASAGAPVGRTGTSARVEEVMQPSQQQNEDQEPEGEDEECSSADDDDEESEESDDEESSDSEGATPRERRAARRQRERRRCEKMALNMAVKMAKAMAASSKKATNDECKEKTKNLTSEELKTCVLSLDPAGIDESLISHLTH